MPKRQKQEDSQTNAASFRLERDASFFMELINRTGDGTYIHEPTGVAKTRFTIAFAGDSLTGNQVTGIT